jgi:hypothetical protein
MGNTPGDIVAIKPRVDINGSGKGVYRTGGFGCEPASPKLLPRHRLCRCRFMILDFRFRRAHQNNGAKIFS